MVEHQTMNLDVVGSNPTLTPNPERKLWGPEGSAPSIKREPIGGETSFDPRRRAVRKLAKPETAAGPSAAT